MWKRVFQSPTIPNPREPGKVVGRDIGFRGMVVHTDSNGEQALYVGGVTADEYIPELAAAVSAADPAVGRRRDVHAAPTGRA